MFKTLNWFLAFSLLLPPSGLAGDDSSWRKPYRTNLKSPEHYISLERLQQREKDLERWVQRNKPVTYSPPKEVAPKIKPQEKINTPELPKPKLSSWERPKLPTPSKNAPAVEKKLIDGKWHTIRTVVRTNKWGFVERRDVIDKVRLDKNTTLTTIKSYSPSGKDLIRQVEKLKIKTKDGYQFQKYVSTQFDSSGNPLDRMLVKNSFKRTGFFNSTLGRVLGIAGVAAATILTAGALGPVLHAGLGLTKFAAGVVAAGIGSGLGQFFLSLGQGANLKKAFVAGALSAGAIWATGGLSQIIGAKGVGQLLGKMGPLRDAAKTFGSNLSQSFSFETLKKGFAHAVLIRTGLQFGSQEFTTRFGKKLGAFGTAAALSLTASLAGSALALTPSGKMAGLSGLSNAISPGSFSTLAIQSLAQGSIAEAFRNHRSLGAQFLRDIASQATAGLDLNVIDKTARGLLTISKAGLGQASRIFTDGTGQVLAFFNHPSNPNKQIAAFSTGQKLEVPQTAIPIRTQGNKLSGLFFRDGKQNVFQSTQLPQAIIVTDLAAGHLASGKTTPMTERMVGQEIVGLYGTTSSNSFQLSGSASSPLVRGIFESKTFRGLKEFAVSQIQPGSPTRVISSLVVDFLPGPGTWKGIQETTTGRDLVSGEKLNFLGRTLAGIGAIPLLGVAVKTISKGVKTAEFSFGASKTLYKLETKVATKLAKTDFYVRSNGDVIPATAFRHYGSNSPFLKEIIETGNIPANPKGTYLTFDKIDDISIASSKLQVRHDAAIRVEFDTKQVLNDIRIPKGKWGNADNLEPIVKDLPDFGSGGATQAITNKEIKVKRIIDIRSGEVLYELGKN